MNTELDEEQARIELHFVKAGEFDNQLTNIDLPYRFDIDEREKFLLRFLSKDQIPFHISP